jgi:hypothetical protein
MGSFTGMRFRQSSGRLPICECHVYVRTHALRVFAVERPPPLLRDAGRPDGRSPIATGRKRREPTCRCIHTPASKS